MNAIIILNYNDCETVEKYLDSIINYRIIDRIVVVDNCSTDDSWERLKKLVNEKVSVIQTNGNYGYSAGNNFGIRYAEEHIQGLKNVIISNPDIIVSEESIKEIISVMKSQHYDMANKNISEQFCVETSSLY